MSTWSEFNRPPAERKYPWNKTGYTHQDPGEAPPPSKSFAASVEKARQDCKTCEVAQPDLVPLGCALLNPGDPVNFEHRKVRQNRPLYGQSYIAQGEGPIYIPTAGSGLARGDASPTPWFGTYENTLFQTPLDRTENKISNGVMMNPYTGDTFETFVNAMPPPNTNKAIDPQQLKHTNPKLVWLNGGLDPNAKLRSKTEICQDAPGPDAGPNVWGDQLYAGRRRQRLMEIVNRDVWLNRNGDHSTESSMNGEAPAGFVGLQPVYRAIPYMPPTQQLDTKDWKGPLHALESSNVVSGLVTTRRVDLSDCSRIGLPDSANGNQAVMTVPVTTVLPTWRGQTETLYSGPAEESKLGSYVIQDTTARATLKEQMEHVFPTSNAQAITTGNYVLQDTTARETLKGLMSESFPVLQAQLAADQMHGYVVQDTYARETLKGLMSETFPVSQAQLAADQMHGYVVQDTHARETLKGLMSEAFPVSQTQLSDDQMQGYVVQDTHARETLKGLMSEAFPVSQAQLSADQMQGYVVQDTKARETLKDLMAETFPVSSASSVFDQGDLLGFQGTLHGTRRQYYSDHPVNLFVSDTVGHGDYVGTGQVTLDNYRGTIQTDYVVPSKTPENGGGDTSSRWIGISQHDTAREFVSNTPVSNFTQDNGTFMTAPRWRPEVFITKKRPDDVDDEFLSVRPTYFRET